MSIITIIITTAIFTFIILILAALAIGKRNRDLYVDTTTNMFYLAKGIAYNYPYDGQISYIFTDVLKKNTWIISEKEFKHFKKVYNIK